MPQLDLNTLQTVVKTYVRELMMLWLNNVRRKRNDMRAMCQAEAEDIARHRWQVEAPLIEKERVTARRAHNARHRASQLALAARGQRRRERSHTQRKRSAENRHAARPARLQSTHRVKASRCAPICRPSREWALEELHPALH